MKQFEGFRSEPAPKKYPMLPAGAYVAAIRNVKVDGDEPDQALVLRLEITEGEWAGYYTKRYEHDSRSDGADRQYPAKYKGDYRLRIPNRNNPAREHPEWDLRAFNNAMYCIEQSNPGYRWDWNEAGLKGRVVGINVREGTYNGNPYTQIGRLEAAEDVRRGLAEPMKPKEPRSGPAAGVEAPAGFTGDEEEELPF